MEASRIRRSKLIQAHCLLGLLAAVTANCGENCTSNETEKSDMANTHEALEELLKELSKIGIAKDTFLSPGINPKEAAEFEKHLTGNACTDLIDLLTWRNGIRPGTTWENAAIFNEYAFMSADEIVETRDQLLRSGQLDETSIPFMKDPGGGLLLIDSRSCHVRESNQTMGRERELAKSIAALATDVVAQIKQGTLTVEDGWLVDAEDSHVNE